jgi:hypothetical protein
LLRLLLVAFGLVDIQERTIFVAICTGEADQPGIRTTLVLSFDLGRPNKADLRQDSKLKLLKLHNGIGGEGASGNGQVGEVNVALDDVYCINTGLLDLVVSRGYSGSVHKRSGTDLAYGNRPQGSILVGGLLDLQEAGEPEGYRAGNTVKAHARVEGRKRSGEGVGSTEVIARGTIRWGEG